MEYLPILLSLCVLDLLAAASPGPNFVLVTQLAIGRGRAQGLWAVLGLVLGNLVWCGAALLGLSQLFEAALMPATLLRLAGGAYLAYLGWCLWRAGGQAPSQTLAPALPQGRVAAVARGLLTTLFNPKSIIYFSSVFALFLPPQAPGWVMGAAVAIISANGLLWYGGVALLLSRPGVQQAFLRHARWINRVSGSLLLFFGGRLLLSKV